MPCLLGKASLLAMKVSPRRKKLIRAYEKKTPWLRALISANQRCNNPKATGYEWNGAKGIKCHLKLDAVAWLWEIHDAGKMKTPTLKRYHRDNDYTLANCFFEELRTGRRTRARPSTSVPGRSS